MKKSSAKESVRKIRPALSPDAREKQLVSLAVDLAERQLQEGTASSQVITHYLKLGSMREQLERERLTEENKLLRAKTESYESSKKIEELYREAIDAIRDYAGHSNSGGDVDDY